MSGVQVKLGSTRLLESGALRGKRVGLVSNPASVDHRLLHLVDLVLADQAIDLVALFGPQHGFRSDVQDNMIESPHTEFATGAKKRIPLYSLYSDTREPTAAMLRDVDTLVIDLQDVGTRIYTYMYTMANCMRAARTRGVKVVVCDRPNPIGGLEVEGITLEPGNESFVGQFPIPTRHGMTIGELAGLFNEHFAIGAELEVIPMEGWRRSMYWDDTGLPWVMPSPNIPTLESALAFPGTVHLEGTNASEGRGTTRPFELVGAPWVSAEAFAARLNAHQSARRLLPAGGIRAHISEARACRLRWVSDSCARPPGVPPGADGGRDHRGDSCGKSLGVCLEAAAVRIRARQGADRRHCWIIVIPPRD